jgi:hypothetical protein
VETGDEALPETLPETTPEVGIDLGLTTFAVLSDGRTVANPRFLRRVERKLRTAQKALSRKASGSNNRAKARTEVAKLHARVADTRRDWLHKESTRIVRDSQAVYAEDLAVAGLARTRLAKSVHDAGWGAFLGMLEYKAARYRRTFHRIGRFEPTSQMCSADVGEKVRAARGEVVAGSAGLGGEVMREVLGLLRQLPRPVRGPAGLVPQVGAPVPGLALEGLEVSSRLGAQPGRKPAQLLRGHVAGAGRDVHRVLLAQHLPEFADDRHGGPSL